MTPRSLILCGATAAVLLLAAGCTQRAVSADLHPLLAPEAAVPSVTEPHELYRMHEQAKQAAPLAGAIDTF
ncbi:MAG: hypothetical protein JWP22_1468 [Ramlibacter sp.]|jgi:hypothetical protein|nr:hypothetical protein [Ramlibacter sp.]MDB5912793.1 hypothetical protein [Ramlibacter sp.]